MKPTKQRPETVRDARAEMYELLAAVFDGETDLLATAIETGSLVDVAETLPADLQVSALDSEAVDREELAVTYDNLFVVPGPRYVAPFASGHATDPTESFESDSPFHDEGSAGELLGDPAATMSRLYQRAGVVPERGEFPDHVASQLAFLAALERARASHGVEGETGSGEPEGQIGDVADGAIENLEEVRDETIANLGWLDTFHRAVESADETRVFADFAGLTRALVAWHARA